MATNATNATKKPKPFLKWVGGKRQLLPELNAAMPRNRYRYFEPFIGGGALLFDQQPEDAFISDLNPELVNAYLVVRDAVEALINDLGTHKNNEAYFYAVRAQHPGDLSEIQRASRFIFINRTCFNGLYRENRKGQINTPFGHTKNPTICDADNLRACSDYLQAVTITHAGYQHITDLADQGDFVYFDPPYVPLTPTANFTGYNAGGFGLNAQWTLADTVYELTKKGVMVLLSNSNTSITREVYNGFPIQTVHATRRINCDAAGRGKEPNEILLTNFKEYL